jgi:hypothetical protein
LSLHLARSVSRKRNELEQSRVAIHGFGTAREQTFRTWLAATGPCCGDLRFKDWALRGDRNRYSGGAQNKESTTSLRGLPVFKEIACDDVLTVIATFAAIGSRETQSPC